MLTRKIVWKEVKFKGGESFSKFSETFKTLFELVEKPAVLSSSFTLLSGLYTQSFDEKCVNCYFPKFDKIEIEFLWPVAIYLIFDAGNTILKNFNDIRYLPSTPIAAKDDSAAE